MCVRGNEYISVKNKDHEWKVAINGKERKGEKKGPKESRKQGGKQRKNSERWSPLQNQHSKCSCTCGEGSFLERYF